MSKDLIQTSNALVEVLLGPPVTREIQKVKRLSFTDFIKDHVIPYYESRGSNNPAKVYQVYSKLLKETLFDVADSYSKIYLEFLSPEQMKLLSHAESMVALFIQRGMADALGYKDLYQYVKNELLDLCIPKTKVPHQNYINTNPGNAPAITHDHL
jgi:hypothetical protein